MCFLVTSNIERLQCRVALKRLCDCFPALVADVVFCNQDTQFCFSGLSKSRHKLRVLLPTFKNEFTQLRVGFEPLRKPWRLHSQSSYILDWAPALPCLSWALLQSHCRPCLQCCSLRLNHAAPLVSALSKSDITDMCFFVHLRLSERSVVL